MAELSKKLFWQVSVKHIGFLIIYMILSVVLSELIVVGNHYIAQAADGVLAGDMLAFEDFCHTFLYPLAVIILFGSLAAYGKSLSGNHYSVLVQRDVRKKLGEHLLRLPFSYFDEKGSGSIMTRFFSDIGETGKFFSEIFPELLVNIATVATITVYFTRLDSRLLLILFASYPVMLIAADKLSKRLFRILKKFRSGIDKRTQIAYDAIQGIAVGRSYDLYGILCGRINAVIDENADHACKSTRISSMGWLLKGIITSVPEVACYFFALFEVLSGRITAGQMLAFTVLLGRMIYPLSGIIFCLTDIRSVKVVMDRLEEIYEAAPEEEHSRKSEGLRYLKEECPSVISWEQVCFAYQPDRPVLDGVSFEIKQGEQVAFVGGSGEGKSTIFKLLCGLYEKGKGSYRLYGKPIEYWDLQKARACYSVVSQNVFLFSGSIGENVACGKQNPSMEEVVEACKAANIHKFILSLPEGYDTQVGERGIRLSGGEKQRISIARAFLKNAPILLMDEPTSAVDTDTEKEIQEAIIKIAKDKTVIVIAHRLSTVKNVDRIYVLRDGRIAESGSHDMLFRKKGIYAELYGKDVTANAT